jgi:Flp pilus assembly protein TadG
MTRSGDRPTRRIRRLLARGRGLLRGEASQDGVAATEFALILPVGLILFTGVLTYGTANEINHKVTLSARTITDLVAQCSSLSTTDMTTLLNATAQVMAPFSSTGMTMVVSQIQVPAGGGQATISWSAPLSGTGYTAGSNATLPTGMVTGNTATTYLLWGHASYVYTPAIGYMVTGSLTLYDDFYMYPRNSPNGQITYSATATTACD